MREKANGFTLIELSIVLVIIGLVIGGVLMGRDLVKAAQHRALHKEYADIALAYNVFIEKYGCLPGDCLGTQLGFSADGNGNGYQDVGDVRVLTHLQEANLIGELPFINNFCGDAFGVEVVDFTSAPYFGYEALGQMNAFVCATHQQFSLAQIGGCAGLTQFDVKFDDGEPESGSIISANEEGFAGSNYCVVNVANPTYVPAQEAPHGGFTYIFYRMAR